MSCVTEDQWEDPTPCADWSVRDLVNHVAGEDRWTVPLLEGQRIEQVGSRFEGDGLGTDPIGSASEAAKEGRLGGSAAIAPGRHRAPLIRG